MKSKRNPLAVLNKRRKDLGISYALLAAHLGYKEHQVYNQLQEKAPPDFEIIRNMRDFMGCGDPPQTVAFIRRAQATRKARKVASMVQGTMGLEAQGLTEDQLARLTQMGVQRYLDGPNHILWG